MTPLLLPSDPDERSILTKLSNTISSAEALYCSVCFWSIGPKLLPGLAGLLNKGDSFCVADIHLPTNIDNLNLFHQAGANVFLFFKELQPKRPDAYLERHLLHTKMLLFDLPGGEAELWVGSHNFTKQALKGINREASLVITCRQGDSVYTQAREYLRSIRQDADCRRFDPAQIDEYKRLQGLPPDETEGGVVVLPLAWRSSQLTDLAQQIILLAGNDAAESGQFAALSSALNNDRAQLAIQALDLDGGPVRRFTATIHNQGVIIPSDPATYEISFGARRLAARVGAQLPLISASSEEHTAGALQRFRYWVSIRIGDEIHEDIEFADAAPPGTVKWNTDAESSAIIASELRDEEQIYTPVAHYDALGYYPEEFNQEYPVAANSNEAAAARVARWLARARQRRIRTAPPEPKIVRATFTNPRQARFDSLSSLEDQFETMSSFTLAHRYEAPILEATFGDEPPVDKPSPDSKLLEVKKLLKRQVVR